jgi:hypothetical protein
MLTKSKAKKILHEGRAHGKPLTARQRRFFAANAYVNGGGLSFPQDPYFRKLNSQGINADFPMMMQEPFDEYVMPQQGDTQLNSSAFQVKGNPNITDGNTYYYSGGPIGLDHNEVIVDDFVFSNRLGGKNSYAKRAKAIESTIGKAEKNLNINPNDTISINTIKQAASLRASLASQQEQEAMAKGYRNMDGSTVQQKKWGGRMSRHANGGQITPYTGGLSSMLSLIPGAQPIALGLGAFGQLYDLVAEQNEKQYKVLSASPGQRPRNSYGKGGNIHIPHMVEGAGGYIVDNWPTSQLSGSKNLKTTFPRGVDESGRGVMSVGSRGQEVSEMQRMLESKGFYKGEVDGIFGPKTKQAVIEYQKWYNNNVTSKDTPHSYIKNGKAVLIASDLERLDEDGIVGDATRSALSWRQMPKPAPVPAPRPAPEPGPVGRTDRQYNVTDSYMPSPGPVNMDYLGGLALTGAGILGGGAMLAGAEALPATAGSLGPAALGAAGRVLVREAARQAPKVMTKEGLKQIPRSIPNTIPKGAPASGGRFFPPKSPSSFGTRTSFAEGGLMPTFANGGPYDEFLGTQKIDARGNSLYNLSKISDRFYTYPNEPYLKDFNFEIVEDPTTSQFFTRYKDSGMYKPADMGAFNPEFLKAKPLAPINRFTAQDTTPRYGKGGLMQNYATGGPAPKRVNGEYPWVWPSRYTYLPDGRSAWFYPSENEQFQKVDEGMYYDVNERKYLTRRDDGKYRYVAPQETFNTHYEPRFKTSLKLATNPTDLNKFEEDYRRVFGPYVPDTEPSGIQRTPAPAQRTPGTPVIGGYGPGSAPSAGTQTKPSGRPAAAKASASKQTPPATVNRPYNPNVYDPLAGIDVANDNWQAPMLMPGTDVPPPTQFNTQMIPPPTQFAAPMSQTQPDMYDSQSYTGEDFTSDGKITHYIDGKRVSKRRYDRLTGTRPGDRIVPRVGDIMQAGSLASQFLQTAGGWDEARGYYDNTQITPNTFNPSASLYQNQRNFQNTANTLNTSSPNLRRAVTNQLYAKKLEADQGVTTQYDQMNQQARTQYEQRLADQARYNAQVNARVDDINQQNKDNYMNAIQNAFVSANEFGKGLNTQDLEQQRVQILRNMYPDVAPGVMGTGTDYASSRNSGITSTGTPPINPQPVQANPALGMQYLTQNFIPPATTMAAANGTQVPVEYTGYDNMYSEEAPGTRNRRPRRGFNYTLNRLFAPEGTTYRRPGFKKGGKIRKNY